MAEPRKPERKPAGPFATGGTKKLEVPRSVLAGRRGVPETTRPLPRPELVTEGMKAHRREIERRKRQATLEKLQIDQQAADTRRAIWKWTAWVVLVLVVGFGYRRLQDAYGDRWPMFVTWLFLGVALFGGIAWILWYMNRQEM